MKKIVLAASLLIFGMTGLANAVPMTWEDTKDWDPNVYLNDASNICCEWGDSLNYHHNIAAQGFSSKFRGGK